MAAPLAAQQPNDLPITRSAVLAAFPADTAAAALDSVEVSNESRLIPGGTPVHGIPWRSATADSLGRIDLLALVGRRSLDRSVAYAVATVTTASERTVDLAVESDDDVEVWLNGVLVHRHVVTRAVWMEADTVTLRLAAGRNRLIYKVANRDGGFGFGGRVLASSPGGLQGLTVAAALTGTPPAAGVDAPHTGPDVTVGPVHLPERAVVAGGELIVPLSAAVTRWGDSTATTTLSIGSVRLPVPRRRVGQPVATELPIPWSELARLAREGQAGVGATTGSAGASGAEDRRALPPDAGPLLDELSRPIALRDWQIDSARTTLRATFTVPGALSGLPVVLEAAELSRAAITVDGRRAEADSAGLVPLCEPCRAGSSHQIVIDAHGLPWWGPALRPRCAGGMAGDS
jgi:hypothetical protein